MLLDGAEANRELTCDLPLSDAVEPKPPHYTFGGLAQLRKTCLDGLQIVTRHQQALARSEIRNRRSLRALDPVRVASPPTLFRAAPIQHEVVRGAIEIGERVGYRPRRPDCLEPQLLDDILRIDCTAGGDKPFESIPVLQEYSLKAVCDHCLVARGAQFAPATAKIEPRNDIRVNSRLLSHRERVTLSPVSAIRILWNASKSPAGTSPRRDCERLPRRRLLPAT